MTDSRSDLELLDAWRAGDAQAGQALFVRHYDGVYRFFDSKIDGDVQELVQETFATLVCKRDHFEGTAAFRTYLFGIARLLLYEHFRALRKNARSAPVDFSKMTAESLGGTPSSVIGHKREHHLLRLALPRIPLELQVLLELYLWEEFTGAQLAEIMGVPENTMRSRFRRAKVLLEQEIKRLSRSPDQVANTLETLSGWVDSVQTEARRLYPGLRSDD